MSESGGGPPPTPGDLLWPALNFILFVALLVHLLREPIREYFRARGERLRQALEAGARARAEAEALRAQLARDIAELPGLRERLRADLLATARQEREDLLERASRAADHIRGDAALVAEQELVAARQAVRAEVIDEAVRQAISLLRSALRPEDQERFVHEFVDRAGSSA
jgi:F-type H+-transporting ATPase subunit b